MTAAHPTLAIPSYARVTNLENGRSVVVRINDRGPFRSDRLIDLSYTAAYKLGLVRGGSGRVEVDSIIPGETGYAASVPPARYEEPASTQDAPARSEGLYLQLGAFSEKGNAQHFIDQHRDELAGYSPEIVNANGIYKVHVGPYPNRNEAESAAGKIGQLLAITPVVTRQ
jgi:rare lipoprotein A